MRQIRAKQPEPNVSATETTEHYQKDRTSASWPNRDMPNGKCQVTKRIIILLSNYNSCEANIGNHKCGIKVHNQIYSQSHVLFFACFAYTSLRPHSDCPTWFLDVASKHGLQHFHIALL